MNMKDELEKALPANFKLTEREKSMIRNRVRQPATRTLHLKPLFISILAASIAIILVLSGIPAILTEDKPLHQSSEIQTPIPMTEVQKQQYYAKYKTIVQRAMEQKTGLALSVPPIEELKDSDWKTPEEYENMIQNMMEQHLITERERIAGMASYLEPAATVNGETTKSTYIYFPDILKEIKVTATFDTAYNTKLNRQLFVSVDNVSSQITNQGEWKQTSYEASLVDGGKTYIIRVEGIFTLNNLSFEKQFTIEFHCDEFGNIY